MIAAELFKRGMHSLVGGVCIVTTLDDQKRHGLVVTSVFSASADRSDETVDPHLYADGRFAGLTSDEADHGPDAGLHGVGRGRAAGRGAESEAIRR